MVVHNAILARNVLDAYEIAAVLYGMLRDDICDYKMSYELLHCGLLHLVV